MRAIKVLPMLFAFGLLAVPAIAHAEGAPPRAAAAAKAKGKTKLTAKQREARVIAALKKQGIDEARAKRVVAVMNKYRTEKQPVKKDIKEHVTARRNASDEQAKARETQAIQADRATLKEINGREKQEMGSILSQAEMAKLQKALHHGKGKRGDKGAKKSKNA